MKTIVNFVLDETGSMMDYLGATLSGFNEYVNSLKNEKDVLFKLTKFNSEKTEVHPLKAISEYPILDQSWYKPNHTTPLYDAIGYSIRELEKDLASRKKKARVLMVTMTDGLENASKEFTRDAIFKMIKEKEAEEWTFVYLGANQDAWAVGASIGVHQGNTITYDQNKTKETFGKTSRATLNYVHSTEQTTKEFWEDTN